MKKENQKTKPEVVEDLPFSEYQSRPGINNSSLHDIDGDRRDAGCPAKFHFNHVLGMKDQSNSDSEPLRFGRALHSYVLTREEFDKEYIVEDEELYQRILSEANAEQIEQGRKPSTKFSKNLGAWKAFKASIAGTGKELLSADAFETIQHMNRSVSDPVQALDPRTAEVLNSNLKTELSLFAQLDDGRGNLIDCKARLDAIDLEGGVIYDLKSLGEWNPGNSIAQWAWWMQAAFYCDLTKACGLCDDPRFGWIFVKKSPPYETQLHFAERELLKAGRIKYRQHLQQIHDCRESGKWGGHRPVMYPRWLQEIIDNI